MNNHSRRKYSPSEIWGYHQDTPSELKLAKALKKAGIRFEREAPIKQFTVDFLIDEWLVVEVDGWSHLTSSSQERDRKRQKILESLGFSVVRIPAMDISHHGGLKQWINKIKKITGQGPPEPSQAGFRNLHFKSQVQEARTELREQARRMGRSNQRRKRAIANQRMVNNRAYSGTNESMDDYFGPEAEDFEKLLEEYDWSKMPEKE